MNDIAAIISRLESQRAAIENAIGALRGVDSDEPKTAAPRGRRPGKKSAAAPKKRHMSEEGRQRIAEAARRRWAAKRAAEGKVSTRKTAVKKKAASAA